MRTNIDIDDRLMRQAMRSSRLRTKRAAVEAGLRLLIQTHGQTSIRRTMADRWSETGRPWGAVRNPRQDSASATQLA